MLEVTNLTKKADPSQSVLKTNLHQINDHAGTPVAVPPSLLKHDPEIWGTDASLPAASGGNVLECIQQTATLSM